MSHNPMGLHGLLQDSFTFLSSIILMGQVRKDNIRDYWLTGPTICTPTFLGTMSRNRFDSIWQAWQFSENSQQTHVLENLFKIQPVYGCFLQKFRSVYSPEKELSLNEAMKRWRGHLKFRTHSPGKITKLACWSEWCVRQCQGTFVTWKYMSLKGKTGEHCFQF
jgi:hypothetical protein